jgi:hypothetical protein
MKTPKTVGTNSAKSTEPKSGDGKRRSRFNAVKDWLFSKEIVVAAAGERVADFTRLKASLWDSVQPADALQEMLVNDLVVNWWRRQRVRRCEAAELKNRLETLRAQEIYLGSDEIEPLKVRFCLSLERYQATTVSTPSGEFDEIVTELENARSQLASTSLGLEFLIKKVTTIKKQAESTGQIPHASEVTLVACAGLMNELVPLFRGINWIHTKESAKAAERAQARQPGGAGRTKAIEPEKAKGDQSGGKTEAGEWDEAVSRAMLVSSIKDVAFELELRKQELEAIEKWQEETRLAAAVLPADNTCDRFSRQETTFDRRFYRALGALLAIKQAKGASKILP